MPRCEGRGGTPFVECPDKRNDDTVRFTQGDSFLCPKCDQFRFGSSVITKKGKSNDKQSRKPQQCGPSSTKCSETRRLRSSVNSDKVSDVDVDDTQESHPSYYYCQDVVSNNDTHILCSICCNIYHQQCSGLYSEVLSVLLGIISQSGWVCRKCKLNYVGLQTQLAKVTAELADMRTSVAWLFEEVTTLKNVCTKPNIPVSMQSTFANNSDTASMTNVTDVQRDVCRTMGEVAERKCNVVIIGLPETASRSSMEKCLQGSAKKTLQSNQVLLAEVVSDLASALIRDPVNY